MKNKNKPKLREIIEEFNGEIIVPSLLKQKFSFDLVDLARLYEISYNYQKNIHEKALNIEDENLKEKIISNIRSEYPIGTTVALAYVHNNLKSLGMKKYCELIKSKMLQLPLFYNYREIKKNNPEVFEQIFPNYIGGDQIIDLKREFTDLQRYVILGSLNDLNDISYKDDRLSKPSHINKDEWRNMVYLGSHDVKSGISHSNDEFGIKY